jgi:hypothetical protein
MKKHADDFVNSTDKKEIETILLSGSVSRGDYCPDKNGGMIDLIVMKKKGSKVTVEEVFGKNEDPYIPFHCIRWNGEWFEILFTEFIDCSVFKEFNEAGKFSVLESKILYDPNKKYKSELKIIEKFAKEEQKRKLEETKGYLKYIVGKEVRWEIRKAYPNMHNNLNSAIQLGINCLYYLNKKYAPAEDRKLYYTYELEKLPNDYENLMIELLKQKIDSKKDYARRRKLFMEQFLPIL